MFIQIQKEKKLRKCKEFLCICFRGSCIHSFINIHIFVNKNLCSFFMNENNIILFKIISIENKHKPLVAVAKKKTMTMNANLENDSDKFSPISPILFINESTFSVQLYGRVRFSSCFHQQIYLESHPRHIFFLLYHYKRPSSQKLCSLLLIPVFIVRALRGESDQN